MESRIKSLLLLMYKGSVFTKVGFKSVRADWWSYEMLIILVRWGYRVYRL